MFRSWLKAPSALVALVAALALAPAQPAAAEEPVKIGAVYIMSGVAATYGEFARDGVRLAVDEINEAGGILGRRVEFVLEDSQVKADVAIQAARKLVFQNKVDVLMGLDSSGVAAGVVPTIPEVGKPLIITHAATPDVTGKLCNKYTFRVSVNINQNVKAAAIVAKETGAKRWTTVGPDYAFGHQSWEFFQKYLKELDSGAAFLERTAFPKFGSEDFTPFINSVIEAKPDGVFISLWGGDLVNFVRQAGNLGFFDKGFDVLMSLGAATEVLYALGDRMPEGVWVGTRYWYAASDNPTNGKFVEAYRSRFGRVPSYNAMNAYAAVYAYKTAIEKAGSTDADAIIEALSGMTFEAPIGSVTFRAEDHQAVVGPVWGRTKAAPGEPIVKLDPARTFDGKDVTPAPGETGCRLGA